MAFSICRMVDWRLWEARAVWREREFPSHPPSMIYRPLSLISLACVAAFLTSCGGSGLNIISKSSIHSSGVYAKRESFALPAVSSVAVSAAAGKPRDKHKMPVYAFSDRNRIVRTTAYTCSEDDHLIYGDKN